MATTAIDAPQAIANGSNGVNQPNNQPEYPAATPREETNVEDDESDLDDIFNDDDDNDNNDNDDYELDGGADLSRNYNRQRQLNTSIQKTKANTAYNIEDQI